MSKSIFIFRRDLRLRDNSGLIAAMAASDSVIPVFIVDPHLTGKWSNATARMSFLAQAIHLLAQAVSLHGGHLRVLEGKPDEVLYRMLADDAIDAVYVNRDYSPYSLRRDARLRTLCQRANVRFHSYADQLLNEPESVAKSDGLAYTRFTPYFNKARDFHIAQPDPMTVFCFDKQASSSSVVATSLARYLEPFCPGNVDVNQGLAKVEDLADYEESRNLPGILGTSRLSAHLRFGTCSVREVHHAVMVNHGSSHGLIRQLYWRDFYFYIGNHFPHVFKSAFQRKYDNLTWDQNPEGLRAWQEGRTGFPIVDAGMRELLATGYMHNRVRMVVASFLTKNLLLDWRSGEAHFAKYLIDYDPAINNGNWQWAASTGCDSQPYFRVFNPWRQQVKFDRDCLYIKQWVPELRSMSATQIHRLEKTDDGYLPKIVDLKVSSAESKQRFKML